MNARSLLAAVAASIMILAACSGAGSTDLSRCVTVSPAFVAALTDSLDVTGGGSLRGTRAVRSRDFERLWFVAADIHGPGLEGSGPIAVWVANIEPTSATPSGSVFAADAQARAFSDWASAPSSMAVSSRDDGFGEAKACVTTALR